MKESYSRILSPERIRRHRAALDVQVEDLELQINNTRDFYEKKIQIFKNLWKKYSMGKFDINRAKKAFSYLTDDAARWYNNQHFENAPVITVRARRMLDAMFVAEFIAAAKSREYNFMI